MQHWTPPSFDVVPPTEGLSEEGSMLNVHKSALGLPTVDEIQAIRSRAHQDAFAKGLQEGLAEGRLQGVALGKGEGFEKGRSEGFEAGFQQGYQSGVEQVDRQARALQELLQTVGQWPSVLQEVLPEWVYETALRLTGQSHLDKTIFLAAVHEALQRLPRPGESLLIRVPVAEVSVWQSLLQGLELVAQTVVQGDAELQAGQAYVEVHGTRIDVGIQARDALVRSALGLLPTQRRSEEA